MYHGLFPDDDTSTIDAEDLPYALSVSDFTRQLDLLAKHKVGLYAVGQAPDIILSFDDGHVSNLSLAAPLLQERDLSAYFFITSNFIDQRKFFMSSAELSELSRMNGMCIGSHGMSHRFFDDLSREESLEELVGSRQKLEAICQSACQSISFPGGRFSPDTLRQLDDAGYTQWFGSEIGLVSPSRLDGGAASIPVADSDTLENRWRLRAQHALQPLERVAIRRNTQLDEFRRIIVQDPAYFRRKRLNSQVKLLARRVIGNRLYHGLYKSLSAR